MLALYCTINCENDLFTLHKKVTRFYCTLGNEQHILIKNVCFLAVLHTVYPTYGTICIFRRECRFFRSYEAAEHCEQDYGAGHF